MEKLFEELSKLEEKFKDTVEHYPLLHSQVDYVFDKKVPEIEELIDKNDEFYLKKAIRELDNLIDYIKEENSEIKKLYENFEKLSKTWDRMKLKVGTPKELIEEANDNLHKANDLINSQEKKDVKLALDYMNKAVNLLEDYEL